MGATEKTREERGEREKGQRKDAFTGLIDWMGTIGKGALAVIEVCTRQSGWFLRK